MSGDPDATLDLLTRWHGGDGAALDELLRRDLPWIREHVRRRLGPALRGRAETMDVVQDAMVQVLRSKPRFVLADADSFRGLIAAIVENALRHEHRDQRRQRRDVRREDAMPTSGVIDLDATRPSRAAARSEDAAWLELGLELLPDGDREVIVLRQWHGLEFRAVGAELGITEEAARKRFDRALARLAPLMVRLRAGALKELLAERERAAPGCDAGR